MCNDMMDCLKKTHKFAIRTLESITKDIEDNDSKMNGEQITRVHRLLDIIKDGEKMKALYGNNTEKEE